MCVCVYYSDIRVFFAMANQVHLLPEPVFVLVPQGTTMWKELRRGRTTSSVAGSKINTGEAMTGPGQGYCYDHMKLHREIKRGTLPPEAGETEQTRDMELGTLNEPRIRESHIRKGKGAYTVVEACFIVSGSDHGSSLDGIMVPLDAKGQPSTTEYRELTEMLNQANSGEGQREKKDSDPRYSVWGLTREQILEKGMKTLTRPLPLHPRRICEYKNRTNEPYSAHGYTMEGTFGGIPLCYVVQMMHQMCVSRAEECEFYAVKFKHPENLKDDTVQWSVGALFKRSEVFFKFMLERLATYAKAFDRPVMDGDDDDNGGEEDDQCVWDDQYIGYPPSCHGNPAELAANRLERRILNKPIPQEIWDSIEWEPLEHLCFLSPQVPRFGQAGVYCCLSQMRLKCRQALMRRLREQQ